MKSIRKTLLFAAALGIACSTVVSAETNKDLAKTKAELALRLEDDKGDYVEAIRLLEEAWELDSGEITYPYELALAHSNNKNFPKAISILEELKKRSEANDLVYQALGNAYDAQGSMQKAIRVYDDGLKKFPESGPLYLERGNIEFAKEEYRAALDYYEEGIKVDPKFASNYYRATQIYCFSNSAVWGMLYGEIFLNMSGNPSRNKDISKLLFETYRKKINFTSDTSMSVNFCNEASLTRKDLKKKRLPFGNICYEMNLLVAVTEETEINLESLDRIRTRFLNAYFNKDGSKDYQKFPNILFDYQQKVKEAGHLSAYNHWVLMHGDIEAFSDWRIEHGKEWEKFKSWFAEHPMLVDEQHRFYREQY